MAFSSFLHPSIFEAQSTYLSNDTFNNIFVSGNCVHININENLHGEKAKASLLGIAGEELQRFIFSEGPHTIDLDNCEPPPHSVRLETKNEVLVKQLRKPII